MDCINCNKCDFLENHSWRYQCMSCHCPNYVHNSYIRMRVTENNYLVNWIDGLASTTISQLQDYKEAMHMAKMRDLIWLPIGLKENNITDFIDTYQTQFGLFDNDSNKCKRAMLIASQIPLGDCHINIAMPQVDEIELDLISESEYNFKKHRDSNKLGFGELKPVNCTEVCTNCKKSYVSSDKFCIRITHSETVSWHIECFQCFQCQKSLVDFHYYWNSDNNIYCMRHFDDTNANRCGGCDELIFHKDYTKAMEKDFHIEHFVCTECDQSLTGGKFIVKDESPLCLNCYENKYANVCDRCSEKISCDSKDLSYKSRHWHDKCFYCNNCEESLANRTFATKENQLYCPNCYDEKFALRCHGCDEPFRGGVKKFEYDNKQWHEDCFCCSECNQSIGSKSFIPKNEQHLCVQCYENKYAQLCSRCKGVIRKGGVTYKNEPWHRECFLCTNCDKELTNTKFTSKDEKPYCAECFTELFSKRCKKCSKAISGFGDCRFISLEEDHWHTECFTCESCDGSLVGKGFVTHNLTILCPSCGQMAVNKK